VLKILPSASANFMVLYLALKFFAVGYGLLVVTDSCLRSCATFTPRKSLPTLAEKLLMRLRIKTIKFIKPIPSLIIAN
jgi:hypothetical protein